MEIANIKLEFIIFCLKILSFNVDHAEFQVIHEREVSYIEYKKQSKTHDIINIKSKPNRAYKKLYDIYYVDNGLYKVVIHNDLDGQSKKLGIPATETKKVDIAQYFIEYYELAEKKSGTFQIKDSNNRPITIKTGSKYITFSSSHYKTVFKFPRKYFKINK